MKTYFVTGIGTDVGKTIAAAILTQALDADYWKPIQAGDLERSDSHTLEALCPNLTRRIHPNAYALQQPMSPHAAAARDGIQISTEKIHPPQTKRPLVIEGAGGLLVPINDQQTILDLIQPQYKVIVVSRHYLGSINHTLLTLEVLANRGLQTAGIIFNGTENPDTESIILQKTGIRCLGRIEEEVHFSPKTIQHYAHLFKPALEQL